MLSLIFTKAKRSDIATFCTTFNNLKWLHKMTDKNEIAMYIAQVGHETMQLFYREENSDGSAYEGRKDLGNVVLGDGKRFKGRAYLQITGRFNYQEFTKWYNKTFKDSRNFINYPEEISQDAGLCQIASLWFWISRKIGTFSEKENYLIIATKLINGGTNGITNREILYEKSLIILTPFFKNAA